MPHATLVKELEHSMTTQIVSTFNTGPSNFDRVESITLGNEARAAAHFLIHTPSKETPIEKSGREYYSYAEWVAPLYLLAG